LFFDSTGAVLDVPAGVDDALYCAWRMRIERAARRLAWQDHTAVLRRHASGASLAITAPIDQLFLATEVNEWALCAALAEFEPARLPALEHALIAAALEAVADASPGQPVDAPAALDLPVIEETAALARFERLAALEARPDLRALLDAADAHGLTHVLDESELTLGSGAGAHTFLLTQLPRVDAVDWQELHDVPTAIVTGSNGKTTTVRLIAACARAHGWHACYNCTDGVFLDDAALAAGDYSGPAGTRMVLRERRAQAAILETARGGILRRGIAVGKANAAVVTNISSDHFGEYGIHDLEALAQVKLTAAAAVLHGGRLILNADDPQLRLHAATLTERYGREPQMAWFSATTDARTLPASLVKGAATCGVRNGRLILHQGANASAGAGAGDHDLGAVSAMPLSMDGIATYNVANMAAAALAAVALGISPTTIANVLAHFGSDAHDNPGRMMRFERAGVTVLIDYAHNTDGLRGFLNVANHLPRDGRLGMLLGQAGNRTDADIRALAQVAAEFHPDLIVVKENEKQLRGRAPGDVPRIIHAELLAQGVPEAALAFAGSEVEAARRALEWAQPGDVLALPVHSTSARAAVIDMVSQ
jgi:UDP-N-acetylmuramyl tripeptide synthase